MTDADHNAGVTHTGEKVDVDICQRCTRAFNPEWEGYFVDSNDIGPDAEGGTAEIFRLDAEKFGEWQGFEPEDMGPWCEHCSWVLQRRRTDNRRCTA